MPAAHGRLTRVYINGYDLTGFYRKQGSELTRETAESTVFGLSDKTYLPGVRDASLSLEGIFDGAVDGIEQVLLAALAADPTIAAICPQGDALGNIALGFSALETKYAIESSIDDIVSLANELQSTGGRDRLLVHHALSTEVATGNGTSLDNGAQTTNGGVAYLQVPDITGITNLAVTIEDSADNVSFATILTFAGVTADRNAQRVAISGTVRRYTRMRQVFTGAGSAQFWVGFGRK
ncbi:MAG: hypothetical protein H8K07_01720 [Nitrospira sp.]|nr:hypothetical protein [Nitrospira sp.]